MRYELRSTQQYDGWFAKLKDRSIKIKVLARLARAEHGNFGDCKQLSSNLYELRFFFGGGIRIYYTIRNNQMIILLAGGNKSTQPKDIERAAKLIDELED